MESNISKYRSEIENLVKTGDKLYYAMCAEAAPEQVKKIVQEQKKKGEYNGIFDNLPQFENSYQSWYSEAKVLIKQLLPDRFDDFVGYYEKPKGRKSISYENYKIEDYLQGTVVTRGFEREVVVGKTAAITVLKQQVEVLRSVLSRFNSSLFDIRQMLRADMFDSELDASKELNRHGFFRAGGALAGVVLERHLSQVCENHSIKIAKRNATIADFNDALKEASVIDVAAWRFNQHLGDIRNLCDHDKKVEPTQEHVNDLITGVSKVIKIIF
jgi:hypothetical protein